MSSWGEAGVVTLKMKFTLKLVKYGTVCMCVGYVKQYTDGVYQIWDPDTKRVHVTSDII